MTSGFFNLCPYVTVVWVTNVGLCCNPTSHQRPTTGVLTKCLFPLLTDSDCYYVRQLHRKGSLPEKHITIFLHFTFITRSVCVCAKSRSRRSFEGSSLLSLQPPRICAMSVVTTGRGRATRPHSITLRCQWERPAEDGPHGLIASHYSL